MDQLIGRLEQATQGNRELSDDVLRAAGWRLYEERHVVVRPDGLQIAWMHRPSPTESIDAALTLVPEGWGWSVSQPQKKSVAGTFGVLGMGSAWESAQVWRHDGVQDHQVYSTHADPALALCIAALKARDADPQT